MTRPFVKHSSSYRAPSNQHNQHRASRPLLQTPQIHPPFIPNGIAFSSNEPFNNSFFAPHQSRQNVPEFMPNFVRFPSNLSYQPMIENRHLNNNNAHLNTTTNLPIYSLQTNFNGFGSNVYASENAQILQLCSVQSTPGLLPTPASLPLNHFWPNQGNQIQNAKYENNQNTIVFENEDDIEMVNMDDIDDYSDGSPYNPNQSLTLLDIDYNLTKDNDLDESSVNISKSPSDTVKSASNDKNNPQEEEEEEEYWMKTRDCDYRIPAASTSIEDNLKMHRRLSRKKFNKLKKRKSEVINIDDAKDSPFDKNVNLDSPLNLENVDSLPYEDLISIYNKIKEELTLLNCDKTSSNTDLVKVEQTDKAPTDLDAASSSSNLDEVPIDDDCQIIEIENDSSSDDSVQLIETVTSQIEKDEETKLNLVLKKETENYQFEEPVSEAVDLTAATAKSHIPEDSQTEVILLDELDTNQVSSSETIKPMISKVNNFDADTFNENLLREQLIRKMLEKRMNNSESQPEQLPQLKLLPTPPTNVDSRKIIELPKNREPQEVVAVKPEIVKPKIDLSRYRLVIELSDGEDTEEESIPTTIYSQINPRKQSQFSRSHSRKRQSSSGYIHKLSTFQQEEYQKLKKEIKRREIKSESKIMSSENLQNCETKLKEFMLNKRQKSQRLAILNKDIAYSMKELKRSQNEARHLKKLLNAANKKVELFSVKLRMDQQELKDVHGKLTGDSKSVAKYQQLCTQIGQKVNGPTYRLPSLAPEHTSSNETLKLKRRMKSFNEIKENLTKSVNKEIEVASKYLRNKIKFLLKFNSSYQTVLLFEHYVSFSFVIFKSTVFFQTSQCSVEFNEFSENRSDVMTSLDNFPEQIPNHQSLDKYNSVLQHFNSYRFASHQNFDIASDCWSNAINPNQFICIYELFGVCNDSNCTFQHQKDYIYDPQEKVIDVLTYLPQFDESLNLEEYKNDPKALRTALANYVQHKLKQPGDNLIEEICHDISSEIKNQSKTAISSFLIRSIPKELVNFSENVPSANMHVPFDDYHYRFDLKDESFQLKLSQLCNFRSVNDPDFYLRNRFFAPEGIPITAQLEASLSSDPHNIQMWINLAYCYLKKFRDGEEDITFCIDSSLNVLSRALEVNQTNAELYELYLIFYSNKMDLLQADNSVSTEDVVPIEEVCSRILKFCSSYRLWICYLNMCNRLPDKERIVMDILRQFCADQIHFDSVEERSLNILEIIMYRINLYLQLNKHEEAVKFFNELFNENNKNAIEPSQNDLIRLGSYITKSHRVFAWLSYVHLILYRCLPYHCFQLGKKSCFLHLNDLRPFMFDWKGLNTENDLVLIEKILNRAIRNCCVIHEVNDSSPLNCNQSECQNSCFVLRFNLAQLNKHIQCLRHNAGSQVADMPNSYSFLSTIYCDNFEALNHLHILQLFDVNLQNVNKSDESIVLNLIENFYNSFNQHRICDPATLSDELLSVLRNQIQFNYWLAFYHYKFGNYVKCKQILMKSLSYYFCDSDIVVNCDLTQNAYVLQLFELILFDDFHFDESIFFDQQELIKRSLKFAGEKRATRMVYLYLSYLMFSHITSQESDSNMDRHYLKLDCVFSSVINSFTSANLTTSDEYKFLWLNYFLILLEFPFSEAYFKSIYETLRLICVTFNSSDPIFIYHLTCAFSELIVPRDRLYFLLELSKLNPDNANLIIKVVNTALLNSKKETCWNYIICIIYEKKIRLQTFEFWKIAISLSIERNDHLNTHKFFQMAISLLPFNVQLWEMLKNYETSINHTEHLGQLKHFYTHILQMDHKLFDSS